MLWRTDDENRNRRSIGHPFARTELIAVMLLSIGLCAGVAGCGSGPASTPGSTLTPTPTPAPAPTPNPAPSVSGISPSAAPAGGLAFTLTVNGSNFINGSTVEWNGSSRTTAFVSSTQLQAHIMAADLASPGNVTVTVLNSGTRGSNAATFTVLADAISFQSARALDGSDAVNTNNALNIWVMNPDGSSPAPLTKSTAANGAGPAFWSPDGSKLVFSSTRALDGSDATNAPNSTANIWVVNSDGSGATPLTKLTANNASSFKPRWSPDGAKILFESFRALDGSDAANTTGNIWVMNADGSGATALTRTTAAGTANAKPAWAPDGNKIVFVSPRALDGSDATGVNSTKNIWLINADGSGLRPLTKLTAANADCNRPSWTPDGAKVLFESERAIDGSDAGTPQGTFNIWVMNADGSSAAPLTKLTAANATSETALASPDGSKIVFVSRRAVDGSDAINTNGTFNIWVMNADGSSPTPLTKLTASAASSFSAVWSPSGVRVLFSSQRALDGSDAANTNNTHNLWLVSADGSNATPLTKLTAAGANSDFPEQP